MSKVFFAVNELADFTFQEHVQNYLSGCEVTIGTEVPSAPYEYAMVVLWNYRKIIRPALDYKNYIVFHSSDLPHGKGWAPVYYAFAEEQEYYTISGILATEKVDAGDIVVQARFRLREGYTATQVREWDNEIMVLLVKMLLDRYPDGSLPSIAQSGQATYRKRRIPSDNEIDVNSRIVDVLPKIRGCEAACPAFFYHNGNKYKIAIESMERHPFPGDLEIMFADDSDWKGYKEGYYRR